MDIQRIVAYTALFLVGLMLWKAWQNEMTAPSPVAHSSAVHSVASPASVTVSSPVAASTTPAAVTPSSTERLISLSNDVLEIQIDRLQGSLVQAQLLRYPLAHPDDTNRVTLFNEQPDTYYAAQAQIEGPWGIPSQLIYQSDETDYRLSDDQDSVSARLTFRDSQGLFVTRMYELRRGQYTVQVRTTVDNQSGAPWQGQLNYQLLRKPLPGSGSWLMMDAYVGAAWSDPQYKRYEKITFDAMKGQAATRASRQGWVAMQEHYFLSAWIPGNEAVRQQHTQYLPQGVGVIGMTTSSPSVAPQQTWQDDFTLYVGPQLSEQLVAAAPNLDLTIDYGWLWWVSSCLLWLLKQVNSWVHNWGWSIVMVTLLIKMAFYQLSASSYRSMAGLRRLQPKIEALKARHGDDKQQFSQAMMEIYRTEKINPLGGCLPMLVQIPVFIALYWVLMESVELRHAPFMGWIQDLSAQDPYYVLPLLMGASMWVQQQLSPPPPDPVQAKMMMFLPFLFTFLFLQFPSGLVLYWVVNNVLSILQQWYITQRFDQAAPAAS